MIAAIREKDFVAIDQALQKFPHHEAWTTVELPVANPEMLDGNMEASVQAYALCYGSHEELLAYAQWCDRHHRCMSTVDAAMAASTSLGRCVHPEVQDVCLALRRLDEAADEASLAASVHAIMTKMAAGGETMTALALAQQPYASTQLMLQKMPLLSKYHAGTSLDSLRSKLREAHNIRLQALDGLRQAIFRVRAMGAPPVPVIDAALVRHCVSIYAHCMTIPTDGPLPARTPKDWLEGMRTALELLIQKPDAGHTELELVALRYVSECIAERVAAIDKRPDPLS